MRSGAAGSGMARPGGLGLSRLGWESYGESGEAVAEWRVVMSSGR